MATVVAKESFSTDVLGYPFSVQKGQAFDSGDDVVKGHKALFEPFEAERSPGKAKPQRARRKATTRKAAAKKGARVRRSAGSEAPVEAATANPGEKRDTQREEDPPEPSKPMTTEALKVKSPSGA